MSEGADPLLGLSAGLLKLNWLNGLADLRRAQKSNHELLAAELKRLHGGDVLSGGEDVIAVESPITHTTNHYHGAAPAATVARSGVPRWLRWVGLGAALLGAGLGGALIAQSVGRDNAADVPAASKPAADPDRSERFYSLDFWE